jgi:hypothetical protein
VATPTGVRHAGYLMGAPLQRERRIVADVARGVNEPNGSEV